LQIIRQDEDTPYNAKWITKFADKNAIVSLVRIYYLATLIKTIPCVWVDGCRHLIPVPLLGGKNITINSFEYKIGSILKHHLHEFDQALNQASIKIQDN
jgi:hypothetical protein